MAEHTATRSFVPRFFTRVAARSAMRRNVNGYTPSHGCKTHTRNTAQHHVTAYTQYHIGIHGGTRSHAIKRARLFKRAAAPQLRHTHHVATPRRITEHKPPRQQNPHEYTATRSHVTDHTASRDEFRSHAIKNSPIFLSHGCTVSHATQCEQLHAVAWLQNPHTQHPS